MDVDVADVITNRVLWCIAVGDAVSVLRGMPGGVFHCAVTSPPYWSLRSYLDDDHPDKAAELGSERTPEEYIEKMVGLFEEVKRVLRDDGVCWLNVGDSHNSAQGGRQSSAGLMPLEAKRTKNKPRARKDVDAASWGSRDVTAKVLPSRGSGLKLLDLCMIPHRLALALQAAGWYVRMDAIWRKTSPMPSSVQGWRWEKCRVKVRGKKSDQARYGQCANHSGNDVYGAAQWTPCPGCDKCRHHGGYILRKGSWRPTSGHEYLFQLTKSPEYFCDAQAVAEAAVGNSPGSRAHKHVGNHQLLSHNRTGLNDLTARETRNPRSVFTFKNEPTNWDYCLGCSTLYRGKDRRKVKTKKVKGKSTRTCPKCHTTDRWVDHFAAFPSGLPEFCIKASTSAKGCCPKCGACWAPVVKRERVATRPGKHNAVDGTGKSNRDAKRHVTRTVVLGWRPTCECGVETTAPCLVLDPFSGTGTTIATARNLRCRAVGIELNPEYAELSESLIRNELPLFNKRAAEFNARATP